MNTDPIIIIDDDADDLELMMQAVADLNLPNEVIAFDHAEKFLQFIKNASEMFLIICDINMSPVDGLELKRLVNEDEVLRLKCVPFIFMSTSDASYSVMRAYSFGVQGYFIKPNSFQGMKDILLRRVEYWKYSRHPDM